MEELLVFVGVAITAAIGGSGVVGALVGAVELSRRGRLRRRVARAAELREKFPAGAPGRLALARAAELDAVRLASLSAVTRRAVNVAAVVGVVVGSVTFLAVVGLGVFVNREVAAELFAGDNVGALILAGTTAGAVVATVLAGLEVKGILWLSLRDRRRRWVDAVLDGKTTSEADQIAWR